MKFIAKYKYDTMLADIRSLSKPLTFCILGVSVVDEPSIVLRVRPHRKSHQKPHQNHLNPVMSHLRRHHHTLLIQGSASCVTDRKGTKRDGVGESTNELSESYCLRSNP